MNKILLANNEAFEGYHKSLEGGGLGFGQFFFLLGWGLSLSKPYTNSAHEQDLYIRNELLNVDTYFTDLGRMEDLVKLSTRE